MQSVLRSFPALIIRGSQLVTKATSIRPCFGTHIAKKCYATLPASHISKASTLSSVEFERQSEHTLEYLSTAFEDLSDNIDFGSDFDVTYSDGVLTIAFGPEHGTYVLNKQSPNKQVWLSSPKSGPKRYDFNEATKSWVYRHDQSDLFELLSKEISEVIGEPTLFKNPPLDS